MNRKKAQLIIIVIGFSVMVSIMACGLGGQNNSEAQALQEQVNALATQNALLLEQMADSNSGSTSDEVVAPEPPSGEQGTQIQVAEPTPQALPDGPVPVGTTIIYDGWALTLANKIEIDRGLIYLSFTVRNMTENTKVFRYIKSGVTLHDNNGNHFPFDMVSTDCQRRGDEINITQQLSLNSNGTETIKSVKWHQNPCVTPRYIPPFEGRIDINVDYLVITINDWGPFSDVVFHMDM